MHDKGKDEHKPSKAHFWGGALTGGATVPFLWAAGGTEAVPCVKIADAPKFSWRGVMLDEARHFFGKAANRQEPLSRMGHNGRTGEMATGLVP